MKDGLNNEKLINKLEIKQVKIDNFDCYKTALKKLLIENMSKRVENGEVPCNYFNDKIEEIPMYLEIDKAIIFLAIIDNNVVGGLWAYPNTFLLEKRLFIQLIQIHKEYRGLKIGTKLILHLENYSIKNKYDGINLITSKDNIKAIRFYEKNGFEIDRVHMVKKWEEV